MRKTFAVVRALFTSAVDDGLIAVSPCTRVPLPKVRKPKAEPMPAASVLALMDAMPPRFRVAVALGAGAGLREGEALGLTVARTDFLRRQCTSASRPSTAPWRRKSQNPSAPSPPMTGSECHQRHLAAGQGPGRVRSS